MIPALWRWKQGALCKFEANQRVLSETLSINKEEKNNNNKREIIILEASKPSLPFSSRRLQIS